ncbi:hypothetical protein DesyoDRAFT_1247 [Desulfosporosinus youngiae DSM 17734]|uniref:Uncharacterized protein n=1 Tax=Desulfosporosinus youngiae DSM 17734 TaxID=768710 RepID=H5XTF6_9FIRM|nr:hypothetical protein DesyoDRAFT_1247 [Desulfosporosinus youngiae DSM 17734]
MNGLDFLLTSICFTFLGFGLCYITLSSNARLKAQNDDKASHIIHK